MKTLLLLRHAKSDRSGAGDHERPLNKRGRSSARRIGTTLSLIHPEPGKVLTSSAVRARTSPSHSRITPSRRPQSLTV